MAILAYWRITIFEKIVCFGYFRMIPKIENRILENTYATPKKNHDTKIIGSILRYVCNSEDQKCQNITFVASTLLFLGWLNQKEADLVENCRFLVFLSTWSV